MCRTINGIDVNFEDLYRRNINAVIETGKPICTNLRSAVQKDGRGNICPCTIILPTLAMEAEKDVDKFFRLLNKKLDEAKDSLIERFEWICSQSWESARFMYQNNVMAGYIPEEGIRSALKHGTVVIGMIGIAETLQILIGCNQTSPEGLKLAKKICQLYKQKCAEYKEQIQQFKVTDDQLKQKMIYLAEKELGRSLTKVEISKIVEKIKNP